MTEKNRHECKNLLEVFPQPSVEYNGHVPRLEERLLQRGCQFHAQHLVPGCCLLQKNEYYKKLIEMTFDKRSFFSVFFLHGVMHYLEIIWKNSHRKVKAYLITKFTLENGKKS